MKEYILKLKMWWFKRNRKKWRRDATFLMDEGRFRCMNYLAIGASRSNFKNMVSRCKSMGADTLYLYTSNVKDGSPVPTSFYTNNLIGGEIRQGAVKEMQERLLYALEQKMYIVIWLFADDSGAVAKLPLETKLAYARDVKRLFADYADEWVVALEANEYMTPASVSAIADVLRGHGKKVGCHQTQGKCHYARGAGIDIHYHQYGFNQSAGFVEGETRKVCAALGKPVVGAEYCLSSTSRHLGQAAMRGGAIGTGNGR